MSKLNKLIEQDSQAIGRITITWTGLIVLASIASFIFYFNVTRLRVLGVTITQDQILYIFSSYLAIEIIYSAIEFSKIFKRGKLIDRELERQIANIPKKCLNN